MPEVRPGSHAKFIRKRGRMCISIENANILRGTFRNFAGKPGKYNRAGGSRSFCVAIDDPDFAQQLIDEGWNVRIRTAREEGDPPSYYIQVAVRFENYPPNIYMLTRRNRVRLDEDSVKNLDYAEIVEADVIISPSNWEVNGNTGIKAYLDTMYVTIEEDEFAEKYASEEYPQE